MKTLLASKSYPLSSISRSSLLITVGVLMAVVLSVPGFCLAASFDCNRATTVAEKLICANYGLSQLDEKLANTYWEALQSVRDPASLKREQAKWLREVRNQCTDSACVEKAYGQRIAALEALVPDLTADESEPSFLVRCEKSLQRLTIIDSTLIDSGILKATNRLASDMIVDPYNLTRIFQEEDESYHEPAGKVNCRCRLGTGDYHVSIAPHVFNSQTSGQCGAAPPSISVTITRNGKQIGPSITFQDDCIGENIIDAVRIDESSKSITLFSGLDVFERHIEKEFPLNALPQDWYSAFFDRWPSGNPLADLRHGLRTHDFGLVTQALDSGADVNFHAPGDMTVLSELFYGRPRAKSEHRLAEFDEETDRLLAMLLARGASPTISTEHGADVIGAATYSGAPIRTVRMLLDAGWPKDYQYRLYAGAEVGSPQLVKEALDHGADPNATTRGGRPLAAAIARACVNAREVPNGRLDQAQAAMELLLRRGAVIDEGKPREGGGDIVRTYVGCGGNPNIRPVFELLIRYASPAARSNSLHWLQIGASSAHPARRNLLDWLLKRLDQEEQNSQRKGKKS